MSRLIAIGDIHGCSRALAALIGAIAPQVDDTLVTLGDYVDRGPDSRHVLDQLLALAERTRLVALRGNHDDMLLDARESATTERLWLACGGNATLAAYEVAHSSEILQRHLDFLAATPLYYETDTHFFVHGNYQSDLPLAQQDRRTLLWLSLRDSVPGPHCSGKIAVVGHTPQRQIVSLGHLIDVDTACCYGGWLTALEVHTGQIWQANEAGEIHEEQVALSPAGP